MKKHLDYYLLFTVVALLVFGFLFLATLSASVSLNRFGNTTYYLFHQLIYGLLPALIFGVIVYKFPLRIFKKIAIFLLLANIAILLVVFIPFFGSRLWGASRWINLFGVSFQPSEVLKITAILYLSALISNKLSESRKRGWINTAKKGYDNLRQVFLPFVIFLGIISAILVLQPDISTLGIIVLTSVVIYFCAKTPVWHTLLIFAAGAAILLFLIKIEPYRLQRLSVFLNPETDPMGIGYQVKQSSMAIGSGGIFGKGLGMSTQKSGYLPQAMSDSIFAILAEETGIWGSSMIIFLFLFLAARGIKIAMASGDKFSQLAAIGITFWLTIQAFINIASSAGIFPLSGIPLPFFSYGGSHLFSEIIGVGILLNISKNT